ncbi:cytochrome b [Neoroseomonas soli]|uniref:Cytochrome b n=1 Tax=Neoroseomonas soli TaxID=1081025 RepID=A0A9X9X486_9PROT|nr:cytochrome b/b6 domain-containing protein [Neoroseomonas soli]MBR0674215.1 cytochrome b [Neoroseomonas soli]
MHASRYSLPGILFHWTMALAVLLAWGGMQLAEALGRGPAKTMVVGTHALLGLIVLALLLPRILARLLGTSPGPAPGAPVWEQRLALAAHLLLYALMLLLPVSGILVALTGRVPFDLAGLATLPNSLAGTGLRRTVKEIHELLANLMLATIVLHVAAVLWHAFVRRDGVAARMSPLRGDQASASARRGVTGTSR